MRSLRWIGIGLAATAGVGVLLAVVARFSAGPIGYFPGGALSGDEAGHPVTDWTQVVADGTTVEVETRPKDPYSVTIEARIRDGRLYSWSAWEHDWNTHLLTDPRAVVAAGGKLYPLLAVPVSDADELALLHRRVPGSRGDEGGVAFRFDPRP